MLASAGSARQRPLEGVHALLVEDDADILEGLTELLRTEGARVSSAATGNSGFAAFLRERPDILVSDLWMPDGSGFDLVGRVRHLPVEQGALVPAVALSAAEDMRAALMAGFHVFLGKPFDWLKLVDVIGDFTRPDTIQGRTPWTLSTNERGQIVITFVGWVEAAAMRAMTAALLVYLEQGRVELVCDLRRMTGFAPSAASVGERAVWAHRRSIESLRVVGADAGARLVTAAACKVLGVPCTFSGTTCGEGRAEP